MKANELRIGNYVFYENVTQIKSLGEHEVILRNGHNPHYEGFIPIPLTEEWLLKLGFEKHEVTLKLYYSDFKHEDRLFRFYWPENGRGGSLHLKPDVREWYPDLADNIKYVHQFQNLYFALTGNELEIK